VELRPAYKVTNNAHKTNKKVAKEKMKKEGEIDDKTNQIKIQEAEGANTEEPKEKNALQEKTKDETSKEEKTGAISTQEGEERNGKGSTNNNITEENKKEKPMHPMRIRGGEGIEE
jgi:hypothetical protein